MSATVIRMDSIPRSDLPSSSEEAFMEGFRRALDAVDALKLSSMRETIITLEAWLEHGLMTESQVDALFSFHGWRRG